MVAVGVSRAIVVAVGVSIATGVAIVVGDVVARMVIVAVEKTSLLTGLPIVRAARLTAAVPTKLLRRYYAR